MLFLIFMLLLIMMVGKLLGSFQNDLNSAGKALARHNEQREEAREAREKGEPNLKLEKKLDSELKIWIFSIIITGIIFLYFFFF